jgi:hypothetical protein
VPETHTADTDHLRVLLELIRAGKIRGRPQVLVRPAPTDQSGRFERVAADFAELIVAPPCWRNTAPGDWQRVIPCPEDVQFLANLTYHADLNVNFGSTMTLDFAIRDKPVVNVAFDVRDPPTLGMSLWDYLCLFEHYRPVIELRAARFARSPGQLVSQINDYLDDPTLDQEGRRRFVELEVGVPVGASSQRIVDVLESISC